ncbi:MAG: diguanylate cyclase [Spirochaetia bacterium]|nr:diguanylate cyclase [Spirochaetia bacterium]
MKTEQILIVEDEGIIAKEIQNRVERLGYLVTDILDSGEAAIETVHNNQPNLILMDIKLKGEMDGIETARKIRMLYNIPIIYLTAHTDEKTLERAKLTEPYGYIVKPFDETDFKIRIEMALYKHKMECENKELLEEANKILLKNLQIDSLTGIANRRKFDLRIKTEWKRTGTCRNFLSLILIDIDYFKNFNDTYGHQKGDDCLILTARTIEACLTRKGDLAARYGGEEFAVIMPATPLEGAIQVGERIRKEVENLALPHERSRVSDVVTISLGICTVFPNNHLEYYDLIKKADEALYEAKEKGRNQISYKNLGNFTAKEKKQNEIIFE